MSTPLSEKLRPQSFQEIFGQPELLSETGFITRIVQSGHPLSIILWGPPGTGKTSIARLYAKAFSLQFRTMSAVFSGVADIKKIIKDVEEMPLFQGRVVLFVDEIHRFNKSQQDAFLPYVENGTIILVGATVENPSFYLNNALLSRVRVLTLKPLDDEALDQLIKRFEKKYHKLSLKKEAKEYLKFLSQGDGRYLYNLIESIETVAKGKELSIDELKEILQKRKANYDKGDEQHYNLISALHKSVRGSDVDAALYWFARMLEGGEEPLYIARRLIRMASEDIGGADPQALPLAIAGMHAYQMLGSPEGELSLAQVVIYLVLAPKSNATYVAFNEAKKKASDTTHLDPPLHILNAPTKLMRELGYGKDYIYDPDLEDSFSGQNYFPEKMKRVSFYKPVDRGFEREMQKRLHYFNNLRKKKREPKE